ncbi:hypothetical protein [Alienimonas chondri]|uniref:Uncharacterized protein n=1 Tax=Alienimonas chondri TaxID=2681879 RepID=A0ABX1VGD2_9PLAN|nr:hypothetical protein [Alienimonas chondri]NNJ27164.1 hypothetical protein [Alienimonas chondri]
MSASVAVALAALTFPAALPADDPAAGEPPADGVVWDEPRDGWRTGAEVISGGESLRPGDPLAIQFLLKNETDESRDVTVDNFEVLTPTLAAGNRLQINVFPQDGRRRRHTLDAGETFRDRRYRLVLDTAGLPSGSYLVKVDTVFWTPHPDREDGHRGLAFRQSIPVTIGEPTDDASDEPNAAAADENADPTIHWGEPVAGLALGSRLMSDAAGRYGDELKLELIAENRSAEPITFTYDLPRPMDFNQHVERPDGQYVSLNVVWMSGLRIPNLKTRTLAPGERQTITETAPADSPNGGFFYGPTIELVPADTKPRTGTPQLASDGGEYRWFATIRVTRPEIPDFDLSLTAGGAPLTVVAAEAEPASP